MNMNKKNKIILICLLALFFGIFSFLFLGSAPAPKHINWGTNFSQKYCSELELDWKEVFIGILDDLGAKKIKIAAHWDLLNPANGQFNFEDISWQLSELEKRNGKAIVVLGMKSTRWPECHIPGWAANLPKAEQQKYILTMLEKTVVELKENKAIEMWQIENEPFFSFGKCPWQDEKFLEKEVALVRSFDPNHKIVISDSGEGSFWTKAARIGDALSITMYRKAWFEAFNSNVNYPFPPVFYYRKALLIQWIFGKSIFCGELQGEPWARDVSYRIPVEEQLKSMDLRQFIKNINYAKETGLSEFYLWGTEWAYWLKEKYNDPSIWEESKKIFK